jgi:segregation and condensation protein B
MSDLKTKLESLLLVAAKPLTLKNLATLLAVEENQVEAVVRELMVKYNQDDGGIHLAFNDKKIQFITNPKNAKFLQEYFKEELTGELTKPSLEALTIIAYRQPISKEELEQIRGVNCSLILRNLLIRGYIEVRDDKSGLTTVYSLTMDFLRHLGISSVEELPDYEKLNSDANLQKLLEANLEEPKKE